MSDAGISGYGTTLAGATTGAIAEIQTMNLSGTTIADIDVTTMDSPDGWMQSIAGLKNPGELTMNLIYEKSNYDAIHSALGAANEIWTITLPDGSIFSFSGHINRLGIAIPFNDAVKQDASIKIDGEITFTPASA